MRAIGTVSELNLKVEDHCELVHGDAYGARWIIKSQVRKRSQLDAMMGAAQYKEWGGK